MFGGMSCFITQIFRALIFSIFCGLNGSTHTIVQYGGFHKWGYPQMDGLQWKILLEWMIWGYPHLGHLHILPVDTSWPQEIKHLLSDPSEVTALQFSPAGNWLAVGHRDGQVQVF